MLYARSGSPHPHFVNLAAAIFPLTIRYYSSISGTPMAKNNLEIRYSK